MKVSFKTLALGFALAIGTLGFFNNVQAGINPTVEACKGTNSNCMSAEAGGIKFTFFKSEPTAGVEIKTRPGN